MRLFPVATALLAMFVGLAGCASTEAPKPSLSVTKDIIAQAEIMAIDRERRFVSIRGPEGHVVTVKAHPAMNNFDQLSVGDIIEVDVHQSIVLSVTAGGEVGSKLEMTAAQSAEGLGPAIGAEEVIEIHALVTAIDYETRMVTFEMENGYTQTLKISRSAKDLESVKVGDVVNARMTLAIAISAHHPEHN